MALHRRAYVAGQFYPADPKETEAQLQALVEAGQGQIAGDLANETIIGGIVPHAAHQFSGAQAVHFFELLRRSGFQPDTCVVMHPNHRAGYAPVQLAREDYWDVPGHAFPVDTQLRDALGFEKEATPGEHSAEVMLPMLAYFLQREVPILPIAFTVQDYVVAADLSGELQNAAHKLGKKLLLIASSDFSHFLPPKEGAALDDYALDDILHFRVKALEATVRKKNISICGYGPIMALLHYAQSTGPAKAKILKRGSSGDVYPSESVVNYNSVLVYRGES